MVGNIRWKIVFGGKYSVETCWWEMFDKMGGDKLTWGFGLTVGDELTAREPDF